MGGRKNLSKSRGPKCETSSMRNPSRCLPTIGLGLLGLAIAVAVGSAFLMNLRNSVAGIHTEIPLCPVLHKLLSEADLAISRAGEADRAGGCSDPESWLHHSGVSPLSGLPGFQDYNASMMWGTYRPGVYFGFKSRTAPDWVGAGLMWHAGADSSSSPIRHECSEGDGLERYGWLEHDGVGYGSQEIVDTRSEISLKTLMVKPAVMEGVGGEGADAADVHLVSRIEVSPTEEAGARGDRRTSIYLYFGVDCNATSQDQVSCLDSAGAGVGLEVSSFTGTGGGDDSMGSETLLISGSTLQLGRFVLEATPSFSKPDVPAETEVQVGERMSSVVVGGKTIAPSLVERESDGAVGTGTLAYVGKAGVGFADINQELERMRVHHGRRERRQRDGKEQQVARGQDESIFKLGNTVAPHSNIVVIQ
ncbi:unnamed protein product, partial [Choristocarpus tenellus]